YGTHRTAGDDAGPGRSRTQEDSACTMAAGNVVVQRSAFAQRHPDEAAFGRIGRFADRLWHLASLPMPEAHPPLFFADHHERSETETAPPPHPPCDPGCVPQPVHEFAPPVFPLP